MSLFVASCRQIPFLFCAAPAQLALTSRGEGGEIGDFPVKYRTWQCFEEYMHVAMHIYLLVPY
jgi:hypothetical protein